MMRHALSIFPSIILYGLVVSTFLRATWPEGVSLIQLPSFLFWRTKVVSCSGVAGPATSRCRSCYAPARTPRNLPSLTEAARLLGLQRRRQAEAQRACEESGCAEGLPLLSEVPEGEYEEGTTSSSVLAWAASRADARAVLEIGASYGGGSTRVLALGASGRGQAVTSLEAVEAKWLVGSRYWATELPGAVDLLLASSVGPGELPTRAEANDQGDPRPRRWLDNERALAAAHGFGLLAPLLATGDFGFVFVDGGAFTGPAEWATIEAYATRFRSPQTTGGGGSNIRSDDDDSDDTDGPAPMPAGYQLWVALDDTHAKTLSMLLAASKAPSKWEVVYEELGRRGLAALRSAGYAFNGGSDVLARRGAGSGGRGGGRRGSSAGVYGAAAPAEGELECVGWRRSSASTWGAAAGRAAKEALARGAADAGRRGATAADRARATGRAVPRNFALLRLRRDGD